MSKLPYLPTRWKRMQNVVCPLIYLKILLWSDRRSVEKRFSFSSYYCSISRCSYQLQVKLFTVTLRGKTNMMCWKRSWEKLSSLDQIFQPVKSLQPYGKRPTGRPLLVLDDKMSSLNDSAMGNAVVDIVCVLCNHCHVSCIITLQNLFHASKAVREISLNSQYICLFRNNRSARQVNTLGWLRSQGWFSIS